MYLKQTHFPFYHQCINLLSKADGAVLQTRDELEFFDGKLKNTAIINNPVKANLPEPFEGEFHYFDY